MRVAGNVLRARVALCWTEDQRYPGEGRAVRAVGRERSVALGDARLADPLLAQSETVLKLSVCWCPRNSCFLARLPRLGLARRPVMSSTPGPDFRRGFPAGLPCSHPG
ncbi:hypothetical protein NDU88_005292 [Pleurodeles waltl]|uniref:Uncharacterized protein n=1 Tax=Pleurodeles waltl TaxID=8319 RepID=A0AAV7L4G2_PLEWA|nr:hypothetical protein NDU88_005292 [Pleurodeles waltl]